MLLTKRQIRQLLAEFSSKPGYIKHPKGKRDLTRAEFEELFDVLPTEIDIFDAPYTDNGSSVAKCFITFLQLATHSDAELILAQLRKQD